MSDTEPPVIAPAKAVYGAIATVMAELCKEGIGKTSVNESQKYRFRGIDAVYNALSPIMSKAGLVVLPRMVSRDVVERISPKGTALFYVTVEAEFDFVAVADGSSHVIRTYGEAMDTGDKATNKAMSAAYKYAAFQAFCIPTEGDNEGDSSTHEVSAQCPDGYDDWKDSMIATSDNGISALRVAWQQSPVEIRKHVNGHDSKWWSNLKSKAEMVVPS